MVRLHLHYPTRRGESVECSNTQDAAKRLWVEGGEVTRAVLHLSDDGEMLRFLDWNAQAAEEAAKKQILALRDPVIEVWNVDATVAASEGWRLVLRRCTVAVRQPS
jgi:hypothetical protein